MEIDSLDLKRQSVPVYKAIMGTETFDTQHGEALMTQDRLRVGPVPEWAKSCPFQLGFRPNESSHVTYLLFERQIQAELGQTFIHRALRLNTMQGIEEESPWRLDFEALQQRIILHWIKTHRAKAQFDHPTLASARVVNRQPASFMQESRLGLVIMLEDLRPGDILEWCYTIESRPLLLPEHCAAIFTLPAGAPVGKVYFSVRFNSARAMQWKSSEPEWQPAVKRQESEIDWVWAIEDYPGHRLEENTPDWLVAYPWIQISDCADWGTVAAAFAGHWKEDEDDLRKTAAEICDLVEAAAL